MNACSERQFARLLRKVEALPDATPEQHASLRPYVEEHAPDLVAALWGTP